MHCNDVADLTSVIKIRPLEEIDSAHPAFQGHSRSLETTWIDLSSMISYQYSIATLSQSHTVFEIFDFKNVVILKSWLGSIKVIGHVTIR